MTVCTIEDWICNKATRVIDCAIGIGRHLRTTRWSISWSDDLAFELVIAETFDVFAMILVEVGESIIKIDRCVEWHWNIECNVAALNECSIGWWSAVQPSCGIYKLICWCENHCVFNDRRKRVRIALTVSVLRHNKWNLPVVFGEVKV